MYWETRQKLEAICDVVVVIFWIVFFCGAIGGCIWGMNFWTETSYKSNCDAVYFHEHGRYSVMVKDGKNVKNVTFPRNGVKTFVTEGVPEGSNLWFEVQYTENGCGNRRGYVNIHIHSIDDLNTAGWNHGKFGKGQTHRVQ